jgi:hypothetical protein
MLFDPEAGKTSEQILDIVFRRSPHLRAWLEEKAEASGQSFDACVNDILAEGMARRDAQMHDPAGRAAYHAEMDRREAPFGADPLVTRRQP